MADTRLPVVPLGSDAVPIPDPTRLTTSQLQREIGLSRELWEARIHCIDERLESFYVEVQDFHNKFQDRVVDAVDTLKELQNEKFRSIDVQFKERDIAVSAALQAAEKAVSEQNKTVASSMSKSDATFTKQIDQIQLLINTMEKSLNSKIDDIKAGVSGTIPRVEVMAALSAMSERQTSTEKLIANYQGALLMVGLLSAAIPTIVTVLLHFLK